MLRSWGRKDGAHEGKTLATTAQLIISVPVLHAGALAPGGSREAKGTGNSTKKVRLLSTAASQGHRSAQAVSFGGR